MLRRILQMTPGKGGSQNPESTEQPGANLNNEQTSEEERWFSGELKKELDKVQGHLKQSDGPATFEGSALEKKLGEAETENFNIKQMRDLFEQKAAQLATEIVDIKSRYDEEKSLREAADQRLTSLGQDLERHKQDNDRLQTELLQRPGVEDVTVLQKEMVQVQTLMDSMAREREQESERYKHQYQELLGNHTTAEVTISQLKAELEKGPQEAAVYTQQIHQLQSTVNTLQQQSQSLSDKLSRSDKDQQELQEALGAERAAGQGLRATVHERELELQEAQGRASGAEASLQRTQVELGEKGEEVARLKQEALELQMHAKLLEAERELGELQGRLKEQRQLSGEKLKDREQQAADLQLRVCRAEEQLKESGVKNTDLQHQLDKAVKQQQELQTQQQNTTSKLREAQSDLEQVLRQIGDKDQKIQNVEALLQKSKDSVAQLEAERDDLCAKIQAGEGETAVLHQMKEKNHALQEQLKAKTEMLLSAEASKAAQRADLENHLETAQHAMQDKQQKVQSEVVELTAAREQGKQEVQKLQKEGSEVKKKLKELGRQLETQRASAATLQEELKKATANLSDVRQQLELAEKERSVLQVNLDKLTQEVQSQRAEQDRKVQGLAADLQKAQQQRDAHGKDLGLSKESLAKVNKVLKETQGQLEEERRSGKAALEEKEKSHEKTRQELLKNSEVLTKETKAQVDKMREVEKGLKAQLVALTELNSKTQGALQEKEVVLQQLRVQQQKSQASQEQEKKRLQSQLAELQDAIAKK
ncbi:hypothetical protein CRUP_001956, partial [Coryphaenoides rupestris]